MKKVIGYGMAFIVLTLMAAMLYGADIPLPSGYVWLILILNTIFAFFSIFAPRPVLYLYEMNAFEEKDSIRTYFFKLIALTFSGLNYYAQDIIYRVPFVVSRLISIVFFLFLLWQMFLLTMIF
ncbi:hypothetical protein [Peribacillus deserti]|uniref:Uncharacterized protein n=1 Tax=Peribacillus deserti TaxID=673318 RepID=A0A2N5M608_9BACI|nr:hypothetical protein [Peribacillus deserti]PLT29798.1 hypothetical protein CUU66_10870 [Peribacillus deserti]